MNPTLIQIIGAGLFAVAILHTFATRLFERLAHARPAHAGLWHLLGEVEVVFGFWAMVLIGVMAAAEGLPASTEYLDSRGFDEPMFVFAIMVIAASRPVLRTAAAVVALLARLLPLPGRLGLFCTLLTLTPLLGSFITEPAAMTLAALLLREEIYAQEISKRLRYATLGVLFVNVSIGGTLTPFAAPPVLMVAGKWGLGFSTMFGTIGWKAALAVLINAVGAALLFRRELSALPAHRPERFERPVPAPLVVVHLLFLAAVVAGAHHPAVFMGVFLLFLGVSHAYPQHQDRPILREGLLVAFFLAGLVVLGGQQQWWLQPLLTGMGNDTVFVGATLLTAVTDNAALTYLGSLVEGLSDTFKYALLTGAVTGGGLTIIANAPNPAGIAILRGQFEDEAVSPLGLLTAALPPTLVAAAAFMLL